ncbi:hypothetical protein YC2023_071336 [Brassica napus]
MENRHTYGWRSGSWTLAQDNRSTRNSPSNQLGREADRYIWSLTDHGSYTVKSGNWLAANNVLNSSATICPLEQRKLDLKKKLWKVKIQPKLRLFLWRAVSGALTVANRLQSRGMNVDVECKLCHNNAEPINHVLFECVMAQELLRKAYFPPPTTPARDLCENMKTAMELMENNAISENLRRAIPWKHINIGNHLWKNVVIGVDNQDVISALSNVTSWPRYRTFLNTIADLRSSFSSVFLIRNRQKPTPSHLTLPRVFLEMEDSNRT